MSAKQTPAMAALNHENKIKSLLAQKNAGPRIVRYFPNTYMGYGHQGLSEIAREKNIDVSKLAMGEYVIFVNRAMTAFKMFAPGNVIAYFKMPEGQRLYANVISLLPRFFDGKKIAYDDALAEIFKEKIK